MDGYGYGCGCVKYILPSITSVFKMQTALPSHTSRWGRKPLFLRAATAAGAGEKTSDTEISNPSLWSFATNVALASWLSLVQKRSFKSDAFSLWNKIEQISVKMTELDRSLLVSGRINMPLAKGWMFETNGLLFTHFFRASTEPEIATPPPSPQSYKTPHKSNITPFKLFEHTGQPTAAMANATLFRACA